MSWLAFYIEINFNGLPIVLEWVETYRRIERADELYSHSYIVNENKIFPFSVLLTHVINIYMYSFNVCAKQ